MPGMKMCSKCKRVLPCSAFNKAKWIKSGLRSDCKECYRETKQRYWAKQSPPERKRYRALKAERAAGLRTCRTCGQQLQLLDDNFALNKGCWNSSCRPCVRSRTRQWMETNPERARLRAYQGCAERYAAKRQRMPEWLSKEQKQQIKEVYAESRGLRLTGLNVHVDHIVPLMGKSVSGLHVPWNLQIITAHENAMKLNRFSAS